MISSKKCHKNLSIIFLSSIRRIGSLCNQIINCLALSDSLTNKQNQASAAKISSYASTKLLSQTPWWKWMKELMLRSIIFGSSTPWDIMRSKSSSALWSFRKRRKWVDLRDTFKLKAQNWKTKNHLKSGEEENGQVTFKQSLKRNKKVIRSLKGTSKRAFRRKIIGLQAKKKRLSNKSSANSTVFPQLLPTKSQVWS